MAKTIRELVMEYFMAHPHQDLPHGPVVDWVSEQYSAEQGSMPRDPWRTIRQLHQEGKLIKVEQGIYKYDPNYSHDLELYEFPAHIKKAILERDNYRCVVCGRGTEDGISLAVDHIKPKDKGAQMRLKTARPFVINTTCSNAIIHRRKREKDISSKFII